MDETNSVDEEWSRKGFEPIMIPLTVDQTWDCFFGDNAPAFLISESANIDEEKFYRQNL